MSDRSTDDFYRKKNENKKKYNEKKQKERREKATALLNTTLKTLLATPEQKKQMRYKLGCKRTFCHDVEELAREAGSI